MIHRIFFFLLIVFLPTQLGLHFWPEWSYVLGRRIDFLSPTLFLSDIFLLLTCVSWSISWIRSQYTISNHQYPTWKKKNLYLFISSFFLFFIFIYFNCVNASSRSVAVYSWVKFFEYLLLFFYIVKTKPSIHLLSIGLTIGVLYSSGIAIGQFLLQHSLGGIFWYLGERTFTVDTPGIARFPLCLPSFLGCIELLRSYATFPHPNVLAGYLAVGIPIALQYQKSKIKNQIYKFQNEKIDAWLNGLQKIAIVLGLVALLVTFSRSAILMVVIFGLFSVVKVFYFDRFRHMNTEKISNLKNQRSKIQIKYQKVFGTIRNSLLGICTLLFVIPLCIVGLYVLRSVSPFDESVVVREELVASALKLFQSAPLFGIGLGNFIVRLPDVLTAHAVYFLQPVHNIYILLLTEVGVVGVAGFVVFVLLFAKSIKGLVLSIKGIKLQSVCYPLLTILVLGLVDHYWLTLQQGQLLLTVILGYVLVSMKDQVLGERY
ncbi:O-antigen ligase family protein [Candidatus Gottesmanbacteria bacterium]|nr:O-antigen ligase family protein [Candidatus Gottesmanbacteria bacterium]